MAGTKAQQALAEGVLARLESLVDTSPRSGCGVADEHKEGVRIYVESWLIPAVEALAANIRGEEKIPDWLADDNKQAAAASARKKAQAALAIEAGS